MLIKLINRLERKYQRFAVRNLMSYIIIANAIVYLLTYSPAGSRLYYFLLLIPQLVLRGEIWRLLTFIAIPPSASLLWIFFALYFYYMIGSNLEHAWGAFKFNIFYFCGIILTIIASFLTGAPATAAYLNLSLFLAFAHLYPDFQLLIFFILPVKVKYLAVLTWLYIAYTVIFEPLPLKIMALVPVVLYLLFFGDSLFLQIRQKRQVYANRKRFFTEIEKARQKRR